MPSAYYILDSVYTPYIIYVVVSHLLVFETDVLLTHLTLKYSCILFMYNEGVYWSSSIPFQKN